eukprot:7021082-Heterocapsa_arctica.AAC.1
MQLKERYFTTPLGSSALASLQHFSALILGPSSTSSAAASVSDSPTKRKRAKKPWTEKILKGSGKGKGKEKARARGRSRGWPARRPTGANYASRSTAQPKDAHRVAGSCILASYPVKELEALRGKSCR